VASVDPDFLIRGFADYRETHRFSCKKQAHTSQRRRGLGTAGRARSAQARCRCALPPLAGHCFAMERLMVADIDPRLLKLVRERDQERQERIRLARVAQALKLQNEKLRREVHQLSTDETRRPQNVQGGAPERPAPLGPAGGAGGPRRARRLGCGPSGCGPAARCRR
jgi:hypothetical protein